MGDIRFIDSLFGELERDVSISFMIEIINSPNGIAAVIAEQDQIVSVPAELNFAGFDIGKPESLFTLMIRHEVRTVSFGKDVGVVPLAAVQLVITGTASQDIVTGIAVEFVVACTAVQDIVAVLAA